MAEEQKEPKYVSLLGETAVLLEDALAIRDMFKRPEGQLFLKALTIYGREKLLTTIMSRTVNIDDINVARGEFWARQEIVDLPDELFQKTLAPMSKEEIKAYTLML